MRSAGGEAGFANVKEERKGRGNLGLGGLSEAKAIDFGYPFRRSQKDLPGILALGDEDAIEADIVHDDAVGQVVNGEGDKVIVTVAFDLELSGHALAGRDRYLQRFIRNGAFDEIRGVFIIGFERDKPFWFGGETDFAKIIHFFRNRPSIDEGGRHDFDGFAFGFCWRRSVECGVHRSFGFQVTGLDDEW